MGRFLFIRRRFLALSRFLLLPFILAGALAPVWGAPIALAVRKGRCEAILTTKPADSLFLIIGSLASSDQIVRVTVRTEPTDERESLPLENDSATESWRAQVSADSAHQEKARRRRPAATRSLKSFPAATRTFHLFHREKELTNAAHYVAVNATLRGTRRNRRDDHPHV
jgi:hypothetical protein